MIVTNLCVYKKLNFSDYQHLPGTSFSTIRHGDREDQTFTPTTKMRLGSEIDSFLFTPTQYIPSGEFDPRIIRGAAKAVIQRLGSAWHQLEFQLSVTADFEYQGFVMKYRGRPDGVIRIPRKGITIDLKVTEKLAATFMMYPEQLTGYSLACDCVRNIILTVHPKTFATEWHHIPMCTAWWERQVLERGDVKTY